MDEKMHVLQSTLLCTDLTKGQIKKLAAIAAFEEFESGEPLFEEGEKAQGLYIITSGRVKIFKLSAGGKEQILNVFGAGQTVGEAAMFAGGYFPASAQAIEPVRALWLGRERLIKLMAWEPRLAMGMMSVMSRRLHHFTQMVDELSLHDVPMRVVSYLLEHVNTRQPDLVRLDIKKTELAQRLGMVPESLSRALSKLSRMKLIRNLGPSIRLLDREGLERFVREGK
ncbi:MAG: Crp/Fnr family transcriptional regulator [Candidatus Firestonebacteria bacterium]|nr:Crp/Fnr family transcriptional regulator [Candidatus Firestonebacteria bacterium]